MKAAAVSLLIALTLCGCAARPSGTADVQTRAAAVSTDAPKANAGEMVEEFLSGPDFERNVGILEAWRRVPDHERYRMARFEDFVVGDSVRNSPDWPIIKRLLSTPYARGGFNGSGDRGFVLVVTDATKTAAERFGVLLFPFEEVTGYYAVWLYRDVDFTRGCVLERHGRNVYLKTFDETGPSRPCGVMWDRGRGKFICTPL